MNFQRNQPRDRTLPVDLTPMIDVVMLLIVFFLTTAQFARMTRAAVDLPIERGEGGQAVEEPGMLVNLMKDGQIIIDDKLIDLVVLKRIVTEEIRQSHNNQASMMKVLLRADRDLPSERLNQIVWTLQQMGVGQIRLATEVPR
ncbi:MAG: ExbD/TolR family protein [Phycisphaerales bacterium]